MVGVHIAEKRGRLPVRMDGAHSGGSRWAGKLTLTSGREAECRSPLPLHIPRRAYGFYTMPARRFPGYGRGIARDGNFWRGVLIT